MIASLGLTACQRTEPPAAPAAPAAPAPAADARRATQTPAQPPDGPPHHDPALLAADARHPAAPAPPAREGGVCAPDDRDGRLAIAHGSRDAREPASWYVGPVDGDPRSDSGTTYTLTLRADLNGDGRDDLLLSSDDGCSRSGGCLLTVFVDCGDGSLAELSSPEYAKGARLAATSVSRSGQTWRDIWLVGGDRDPDRPGCYLELWHKMRFDGARYQLVEGDTRSRRKC